VANDSFHKKIFLEGWEGDELGEMHPHFIDKESEEGPDKPGHQIVPSCVIDFGGVKGGQLALRWHQ